jgi:STE24 endopeptidase
LADLLLSTGLSLAIGLPLFAAALWLIASFGAWWWLLAWLGLLLVAALAMIVGPRWIAPLFNKFQSLQDQVLQQRIDGLLKRCGFQTGGVFVMDASRRSNHGNAYFTGLGSAKRVVLFDTLLRQLAADEIEAVLAHELGHFKLRHIGKRLGLMALVSGLAVFTLALLMQQPWFFAGLGVSALAASNAMALLLFSLVLPVFGFFLSPLFSAYSRKHEFEADRFASQQADPTALVAALVKLFRDNSSPLTQDPIYAAVYSSHPSAGERIARIGGGA